MTINIFVLKGDLNGKIVVVRFFFCRVYEQDRLRKFKISTRCNRLHVFYLNGNDKLRFSVKLGEGLCITSYKTIYLR